MSRRVRSGEVFCPECLALPGNPCLSLDVIRDPEPTPILESHLARRELARERSRRTPAGLADARARVRADQ